MNGWIIAAVIGAALGALAYFGAPGRIRGGLFLSIAIGAVAAMCSMWLGFLVHVALPGQTAGLLVSVIGTTLVLAIWRTVRGPAGPV
jgi:uncharacterized membrane protein YeaQ/YmgE (transglycosylase-associated protein family)